MRSAQYPMVGSGAERRPGSSKNPQPPKGYKQTEVGVIPEDWDVSTIGQQCQIIGRIGFRGYTVDDIVDEGRGAIAINPSNIQDGKTVFENCTYISWQKYEESPEIKIEEGDIILVKTGSTFGKTAMVKNLPGRATLNPQVIVFKKVKPSRRFFGYMMAFPTIQNQINAAVVGGAVPTLSQKLVAAFKFPLPRNHSEQRAIAEALSDIDLLLRGVDRLIAKKRDLKQAAMQELLTGRRRLPGFRGEWEVKRLGDFTDCTAGGTPSTLIPSYWGGSIRWMSSGELNLKRVKDVEGRITEEGLRNSSTKMLPPMCVLIGLAGQGRTRGTVAINLVELCTNQSIAAVFPSPAFVPEYLYYNLDNRYDELRDLSSGDGGRGGLNLRLIKSLRIPLAPTPEQSAIAEVLKDMDAEISALEQRRRKTRALKQAMMQELLTGKTRLV